MFEAAIFLASALAAPVMTETAATQITRRYPEWALSEGRSVAFQANLVILPDGRARDCQPDGVAGSERLAAEMCRKAARQKFTPATDADGKPILGLHRTWLVLRVIGGQDSAKVRDASWPTDVAVATKYLAPKIQDAPDRNAVQVVVLVGIDGAVQSCELGKDKQPPVPAEISQLACRAAMAWHASPLQDESGHAAPYVTNVAIGFSRPDASN